MARPPTLKDPYKLTLSMSREVVEAGKAHAANQGVSLSQLVSNLILKTIKDPETLSGHKKLKIDLPEEEYQDLIKFCEDHDLGVGELITRATRKLVGR